MTHHKLVIAEKPSVAQSIAAVLGATKRNDGYLSGNGYLVSWCYGHLAELAGADVYDEKYAKWRYDDLPILPANWRFTLKADKQQMVQELSERAAKVHSGVIAPTEDNMLKITSDGRKLGLDQRVINPDLPDDPNSKVNLCVNNIHRIWQDGQAEKLTQLVFCDLSTPKGKAAQSGRIAAKGTDSPELHALEAAIDAETGPEEPPFTIYDDIREKLVARGIPREQIAFIHEANTEVRKKELFAKVRSGQVRVLMGSTFKMGAGMNVQDRLVALHDLDCPWRPGDLEQRSGIVRHILE